MMSELSEVLGAEPPPGISALPEDARAELARIISDARRKQAEDLNAAFQATLRHVPFPVRGIAKKVLLG